MAITWKDKKPVHLISTVPVGNTMETAKQKVKKNGTWQEKEFGCPAAIKMYNEFMGGVELADQRIATYKKHFKTSTWYLALLYHWLAQSCLNAFIVEQARLAQPMSSQNVPNSSFVKIWQNSWLVGSLM